jgi:GAF domain-containing protein
MNIDRLLREVEGRLSGLDEAHRSAVVHALREEIAREGRRVDAEGGPGQRPEVETERRRRVEAEALREVLEGINRPARLDETLDEVLKALARLVPYDSALVSLLEGDGSFRALAARGLAESYSLAGRRFKNALTDEIRESRSLLSVDDVEGDTRFTALEGLPPIRSWCGLPLLVEGEIIGILTMSRDRVAPFEDEELRSAKAVAFSAAAAIRRAELHDKVRRYAVLMEQLVAVDQAVFGSADPAHVAHKIIGGAGRIGNYRGGFFVLHGASGPKILATLGDSFGAVEGRAAPIEMDTSEIKRLPAPLLPALGQVLGLDLPAQELYLVPLASEGTHVGTLALIDPDGETADDRLMESFASRAATAYLYSARGRA